MGFDDVANRMKAARGRTRGEKLHELWHGEAPVLPPLPPAVTPARRVGATVAAYAVMLVGLLLAIAGGVAVFLFYSSLGSLERKGIYVVISIGIGLIVKSTMMFTALEGVEPLPEARMQP